MLPTRRSGPSTGAGGGAETGSFQACPGDTCDVRYRRSNISHARKRVSGARFVLRNCLASHRFWADDSVVVTSARQVARLIALPCLLAAQAFAANPPAARQPALENREGGIVRGPLGSRRLALVFTGHSFAEGGTTILQELARHKAKGSFFFTGDFLTNAAFRPLVQRIVSEGHYLGPHSDKHLLYCPWAVPKRTLISRAEFEADLENNLRKIETFGLKRRQIGYFLPPFEHYNQEIVDWSKAMGLTLVNFTPGTRSNADYTGEADRNFVSSETIFDSILRKEQQDPHGLNGFLLLLHIGSGSGRTDKFATRFGALLDYLAGKGYEFVTVGVLLDKR